MFWKSIQMNEKRDIIIWAVFAVIVVGGGNATGDYIFGEPTNFGPTVNSPAADACVNISADGLSLIFVSLRSGTSGPADIWVATRVTTDDNWDAPVSLANINSPAEENMPHVLADGLSLYFCDQFEGYQPRPGGHGQGDIWVSMRASASEPWGQPENLGPPVNTWSNEGCPFIWGDGCTLLFSSDRAGGSGNWDLWMTTRETKSDEWDTPVPLANVNSWDYDFFPTMSPDGLLLFFVRGTSNADMWMASRKSTDEPFGFPVKVPAPINYPGYIDSTPSFSTDGSTLYFCSNRPGGSGDYDMWQAPILPMVDLNGDGQVDAKDMSILVDYWHTNDPLCDIGPTALGDGMVDIQDLIVLSEYLEPGFGRIAHWKLDEAAGDIAHDSIGQYHADILGDAVWQPGSGKRAGALEFDGVDDYIAPTLILNPKTRSFRIFAWIKGGAPGQTIASQTPDEFRPGYAYLAADSSDGALVTKMIFPQMPLKSDVVITDGEWHEVGLEWDGQRRHLYIDEEEVAVDEVTLPSFDDTGWLNIGTGKDAESGSFWSGLIDDIRIYGKVLAN